MSHNNHNIWGALKTTTKKSIQSSFEQLNIKSSSEKDGSSPDATLVHKAFVKYYRNREPFEGFPDWLGHKEEISVKKQVPHHHPTQEGFAVSEEAQSTSVASSSTTQTRQTKTSFRQKLFNGRHSSSGKDEDAQIPSFQGMFSATSATQTETFSSENISPRQDQSPPPINRAPSTASQLMAGRMRDRGKTEFR